MVDSLMYTRARSAWSQPGQQGERLVVMVRNRGDGSVEALLQGPPLGLQLDPDIEVICLWNADDAGEEHRALATEYHRSRGLCNPPGAQVLPVW